MQRTVRQRISICERIYHEGLNMVEGILNQGLRECKANMLVNELLHTVNMDCSRDSTNINCSKSNTTPQIHVLAIYNWHMSV